jgi:methylmalonyl-CoA mutase cobalamin-binding subunit
MPKAARPLPRVRLFHWQPDDAKALIAKLKDGGFEAIYNGTSQSPSVAHIKKDSPVAIVIDLTRLPSHGRYVGAWVRGSKSTRHIPLVFVGGEPVKVAKIKLELPDAVYTTHTRLAQTLKKVKSPKDPVVPKQMMESDPARTTAQKLGINKPMRVGVIDAPAGFARVIGTLPEGCEFDENPGSACRVTLWFVHDPAEYEAALPVRRALAVKTRLWIAWQKGRRDGLNGNFIRARAIAMGLVDYKICSVNAQWSAMVFAVKK